MNLRWKQARLWASLLVLLLSFGLAGCGSDRTPIAGQGEPARLGSRIAEVAPPQAIEELRSEFEKYQPQVAILSPRADEVLQDTQISVQFRVQDLPLFKDADLGLGPHLHVFLDNQPYQAVYDADGAIEFTDLTPGTHTIRVFASRPWHESFKNEGAYAQTTFHVLTKTPNNNPEASQPLLTYSRPQASYGAEPIMLDFYLTNAPLHLIAQEDPEDDIADWHVRATVNGESFEVDRWQPIYLKGFKPGKNWVQLEFLDEQGNPVVNVFNNTVRLINYEPGGTDTLSKLVRGDLEAAAARSIVDPNYEPPAPEPELLPEPLPEPSPEPSPEPEFFAPKPAEPEELEVPDSVPTAEPEGLEPELKAPIEPVEPSVVPAPAVEPAPIEAPTSAEPTEGSESVKPGRAWGGFFNRRGRPPGAVKQVEPAPSTLPDIQEIKPAPPTLPEITDIPPLQPVPSEDESIEPDLSLRLEPSGEPELPVLREPLEPAPAE